MVSFDQQQVASGNGAVAGTGGSPGRPHWAWVGAHGGAGVTTLSEVVPGGADFGRDFPAQAGASGLPAVVVCRSNAHGLAAARKAAAMAASFNAERVGPRRRGRHARAPAPETLSRSALFDPRCLRRALGNAMGTGLALRRAPGAGQQPSPSAPAPRRPLDRPRPPAPRREQPKKTRR